MCFIIFFFRFLNFFFGLAVVTPLPSAHHQTTTGSHTHKNTLKSPVMEKRKKKERKEYSQYISYFWKQIYNKTNYCTRGFRGSAEWMRIIILYYRPILLCNNWMERWKNKIRKRKRNKIVNSRKGRERIYFRVRSRGWNGFRALGT